MFVNCSIVSNSWVWSMSVRTHKSLETHTLFSFMNGNLYDCSNKNEINFFLCTHSDKTVDTYADMPEERVQIVWIV